MKNTVFYPTLSNPRLIPKARLLRISFRCSGN